MSDANVMKNMELLQKYLNKYQAWGADDNKIADFKEAQSYYSQAIDAMSDFNRVENTDAMTKSAILYTGTFIAMKAVNGFEHVIARYKDEFYKDATNKGKEFKIPDADSDKIESYANLARSIRDLTPEMDLWLKKFTLGQTYNKKSGAYTGDRQFYEVPITEKGLKIYHLKALIDYCEVMIKGINILASDSLSETFNAENINYYFERGSGKLTSLSIMYDGTCKGNPDSIETKYLIQFCTRCKNMFKDFMSAMILAEYPNLVIDGMDVQDLFDEITKCTKYKSVNMLIDFEDNLKLMFAIDESRDPDDLPAPYKIVSWASRAMEIANAMKLDISEGVCKSM